MKLDIKNLFNRISNKNNNLAPQQLFKEVKLQDDFKLEPSFDQVPTDFKPSTHVNNEQTATTQELGINQNSVRRSNTDQNVLNKNKDYQDAIQERNSIQPKTEDLNSLEINENEQQGALNQYAQHFQPNLDNYDQNQAYTNPVLSSQNMMNTNESNQQNLEQLIQESIRENSANNFTNNQNYIPNEAYNNNQTINSRASLPNYINNENNNDRHANHEYNQTMLNNKKINIRLSFTIGLYFRQLIASFFTHSTLSVIAPKTALQFGPCYPSSMIFPYLLIGIIAATLGSVIKSHEHSTDINLQALLTFIIFTCLTGFRGYRGLCGFFSRIARRRPDGIMYAMSVLIPSYVFITVYTAIIDNFGTTQSILLFIITSTVSAAIASSIAFDVAQDPVDSIGQMTISGLIFTLVILVLILYLTLDPLIATSIFGIGLLIRLIASLYFAKVHSFASRKNTSALQLLIILVLLICFYILQAYFEIFNTSFIDAIMTVFKH